MDSAIQWFSLTISPWELVVRGSVMYLGLVFVLRFVLRRDVGSPNTADVLFIVLIADATQNAMSGQYKSIGDGAVLLATLAGWNLLLDWASFRSAFFRRLLEPAPLPLIQNGQWLRANLRREWITTEEVLSKLREHGIEDIHVIRTAYLEPGGTLSIIRRKHATTTP